MKNYKIYISILIVFTFTFSYIIPCLSYTEDSIYVWSNSNNLNSVQTSSTTSKSISTSTNTESVENNSLNLESESAILIEQTTGQILYAHNIHEQLRPASVTKIMSILLIMEALDNRKNIFNR